MAVSVILVAYYGDKWLPDCINSLQQSSAERLHLVLVDNTGNTILDDLDFTGFDYEVISTPHPMGFAEANNYALSHASYLEKFVLFLNQDTVSPSGWIDKCLQDFKINNSIGALSPLIRNYDNTDWDPSFLACMNDEQICDLVSDEDTEQLFITDHIPAPALLIKTDILMKTGPFDPIYGSYYEDYDLCRRVRELGYSVGFSSNSRIRHFSGGSTQTEKQERKRMRQIIRNRVIYQVRRNDEKRLKILFKFLINDFPRRLARGFLQTPSSQPPAVTIAAYLSLFKIFHRLVSSDIDKSYWQEYLHSINWEHIEFTLESSLNIGVSSTL